VLPSNSDMIVFKPDGDKFSHIRTYKVSDAQTYAHPVVSGNRIFVKDQESLALWMAP
jgi:outer membrane protein assembly factor BamB